MITTSKALTSSADDHDLVLQLAASAYLGRYTGTSRTHTESDLRLFFGWCADQHLTPLTVQRAQIERYVRWMQEVRRFKLSTVSRRMAVVTGFYRTCVIDGVLEHSPADYVRRPLVPAESPILGLSHLQFEALLTAARQSPNIFDFALVTLLGLLGLRIFEASGADIADVGEEHGHRVLRVFGKGAKVVLVPLPPAVGRALDHAIADRVSGLILLNRRGRRMDRHCATRRLRRLAQTSVVRLPRMHPHMLRHTYVTTMLDAGVDLRDVQIAARHADPRTTMRYDRARKNGSSGQRSGMLVVLVVRSHHVASSLRSGRPTASHSGKKSSVRPFHALSAGSTSDHPISSSRRSPLRRLQPQHAVTRLAGSTGSPSSAIGTTWSSVADRDTKAGCVELVLQFGWYGNCSGYRRATNRMTGVRMTRSPQYRQW